MDMRCPRCDSISPPGAIRCQCGYEGGFATSQAKPAEAPLASFLRISAWTGCALLVGFLISYCVATIGEGIGRGIGGPSGSGGLAPRSVTEPTVLERYWQSILTGTLLVGGLGLLIRVILTVGKRSKLGSSKRR